MWNPERGLARGLVMLAVSAVVWAGAATDGRSAPPCDRIPGGRDGYLVSFPTGGSGIDAVGRSTLHHAAGRAKQMAVVCVVGHASKAGEVQRNLALSYQRARSVAAQLIAFGVPAQTIVIQAQGEAFGSWFGSSTNDSASDRTVEVFFPDGSR